MTEVVKSAKVRSVYGWIVIVIFAILAIMNIVIVVKEKIQKICLTI